ncbi:unnamed protein product [Didymodactylos carnosus]|uniref:Uncharacterized protein n=1 Tax=Didymodactylos carnosus TaxID=1234261 RepID=A0A814C5K4_9BILA|nr:unnamed protein product [Didymodactylos carnosus]CAF3712899.1 unnamed protein product [Didymodactylos carnosus]
MLVSLDKAWLKLQFHDGDYQSVKKPDELALEMKDPEAKIDEDVLDRIQGSMMGMALGDALGAHVEFRPHSFLAANPVKDLEGGGTWGLRKGQMDYLSDTNGFDVYCSADGVAGNGALMRLAPVPLFFQQHPDRAVLYSGISGAVTHGDQKARDACRYYGALIVAAVQGETKESLIKNTFYDEHKAWFGTTTLHQDIQKIAEGSYKRPGGYDAGIRGKGYIVNALEAALWAFCYDGGSFETGALKAVNLGDDTDTTAAIYGQLAGACYGYKNLPAKWLDHVYAKDFIQCVSKWIVYEGERWSMKEKTPDGSQVDLIPTSPVFSQANIKKVEEYLLRLPPLIKKLEMSLDDIEGYVIEIHLKQQLGDMKTEFSALKSRSSKKMKEMQDLLVDIRQGRVQQKAISEKLSEDLRDSISGLNHRLTLLKEKKRLIETLEKQTIEYWDVAKWDVLHDDNDSTVEEKLLKNDRAIRILCTNDQLKEENSSQWEDLRSQLITERTANPRLRLVYADFSYCSLKLDETKIIPSMTNSSKTHVRNSLTSLSAPELWPCSQSPRSNDEIINVLLLGGLGVGKSTFINAFANYNTFNSLEQAQLHGPVVPIPVARILPMNDYGEGHIIRFGGYDPNEDYRNPGQSVTQHCRSYIFSIGNRMKLRMIDTPGIGDKRGPSYDEHNMQHILAYIKSLRSEQVSAFLNYLRHVSAGFARFLMRDISTPRTDPFLFGINRMIDEENYICENKDSSDLNSKLHDDLEKFRDGYLLNMNVTSYWKPPILSDVCDCIEHVRALPMVREQMEVVKKMQEVFVPEMEYHVPKYP